MDALNLLKFWRNAGNDIIISDVNSDCRKKSNNVSNQAALRHDGTEEDDSFFELVFAAHDSVQSSEKEVKADLNIVDSPKDVFRNKKVFPFDATASKPQSPIALLKSAPKFRVFMLGLKKSKLEKAETDGDLTVTSKSKDFHNRKCRENGRKKQFAVANKGEEVPAVYPMTRDNSLRSKLQCESSDEFSVEKSSSRRFQKDDLPKYVKLIKPLYERASKRYGEKTRFSYQLSTVSPMSSPATLPFSSPSKVSAGKPANRATGLKVVYKHLGKSRSTSSSVGMSPPPVKRRDDSLLQQHDGIQSAILHCKRSYNSANDCSALWRCSSDKSRLKSLNQPCHYPEELKRCSI